MAIIQEFKTFVSRGNVVDLAVGVIMGAAFGKIVSSLVGDILMPPLGLILGRVNFTDLKLDLGSMVGAKPVTINYGVFLQNIFDFTVVAFCIFLLVQGINRLKRREAAKPPEEVPIPTPEEKLLVEIRDILRLSRDAAPAVTPPVRPDISATR